MMNLDNLKKNLTDLSQATEEFVNPDLAGKIKDRMPSELAHHYKVRSGINILINLRIGKVAAAAVIIATLLLCISLFRTRDFGSDNIYSDSKMVLQYFLKGEKSAQSDMLAELGNFRDYLTERGREVFYYPQVGVGDPDSILMHWQDEKGNYRVIFGDLSSETLTPSKLIRLQSRMLNAQSE